MPEPPAPLLPAESERHGVVPDFVGDGPARRAMIEAAAVPGAGGAAPSRTLPARRVEAEAESFRRAAEKAVRSRHVPEAERPIVRRFFELLRQER
ncbi:MAG: hypothetical protein Fur0037_18040 [Planctomycetota bacterium]